ncbi:MAG: A/G-specific adenine glycosylase [Acidobacteriaceae bacterium]
MKQGRIAAALLNWYDGHKRDLPWRRTSDAYAIWISEIMLQQTRVAAVIGYYERFLTRFPGVYALSNAHEDEVLAQWSGLGYYRRARMMHQAAKQIVAQHGGIFPHNEESLRALPGIGRYTAAAIASIAFNRPVGVVDGNVERVLTRLAGISLTRQQCWARVAALLDVNRPGDFNQAMMEMGATLCTPKSPQCLLCPLRSFCRTRGEHQTIKLSPRSTAVIYCLLRQKAHAVLLTRRAASERLMPSMWELPSLAPQDGDPIYHLRHSITNTDYQVFVFGGGKRTGRGGQWASVASLPALPLTGLSRKILRKANILG